MAKEKLRVVPLGGLGEIGINMMAFETSRDIVVVDAGLMFPEEDMLGVDLVIPNISYLLERREKVRAIIVTHGHEDHTGALPYVLRRLNAPIYSTRLTQGLISVKLKESKLLNEADLRLVQPRDRVRLGSMEAEFFRVAHSIPDAVGVILRTPVGTVVHTGDFKLDHTPVMGEPTDLAKLAEVGAEGVTLLLSDSTYADQPGYTPSERAVGEALDQIMATAPGRMIIATFASLISRIQQVIDAAYMNGRKVFVMGRSMENNVQMALELGYLNVPEGTLGQIHELRRLPPDEVVILTTGSQGEPTSGLARMANGEHRYVQIMEGDTVVLSATPIPGNELTVARTVDNLFRQGARVLYNRVANVHVRGHAAQEELKIVLGLVRPRFFIPIHGEYRHLHLHGQIAVDMGVARDHVFVLEDGDVFETDGVTGRVVERVEANYVYVDGLGVGDVDHVVLRDRKHLATDGIIVALITVDKQTGRVIGTPDVVSRGFVDVEESEDLLERTRQMVAAALDGADHIVEWSVVNSKVKDAVAKFLYQETRRRPMILPVAVEV